MYSSIKERQTREPNIELTSLTTAVRLPTVNSFFSFIRCFSYLFPITKTIANLWSTINLSNVRESATSFFHYRCNYLLEESTNHWLYIMSQKGKKIQYQALKVSVDVFKCLVSSVKKLKICIHFSKSIKQTKFDYSKSWQPISLPIHWVYVVTRSFVELATSLKKNKDWKKRQRRREARINIVCLKQ